MKTANPAVTSGTKTSDAWPEEVWADAREISAEFRKGNSEPFDNYVALLRDVLSTEEDEGGRELLNVRLASMYEGAAEHLEDNVLWLDGHLTWARTRHQELLYDAICGSSSDSLAAQYKLHEIKALIARLEEEEGLAAERAALYGSFAHDYRQTPQQEVTRARTLSLMPRRIAGRRGRESRPACNRRTRGSRRTSGSRAGPGDDPDPESEPAERGTYTDTRRRP